MDNVEYKLSLEKRIFYFIKDLIKYPFKISGKYAAYNKGIGDIVAVKNEKQLAKNPAYKNKEDNYFRDFQRLNTKLVYTYIYGPILIGILVASIFVYKNRENYKRYFSVLTVPIPEERMSRRFSFYWAKTIYFFKNQPIQKEELSPLFAGYFVALLGARFLSRNPLFEKHEDINAKLVRLNCLDMNKNPWRFIYTEDAVLIVSFGQDPNKLINNMDFWTSLNFPPGTQYQSKKDMNKFVVMKKQSAPESIVFQLGDEDYG